MFSKFKVTNPNGVHIGREVAASLSRKSNHGQRLLHGDSRVNVVELRLVSEEGRLRARITEGGGGWIRANTEWV